MFTQGDHHTGRPSPFNMRRCADDNLVQVAEIFMQTITCPVKRSHSTHHIRYSIKFHADYSHLHIYRSNVFGNIWKSTPWALLKNNFTFASVFSAKEKCFISQFCSMTSATRLKFVISCHGKCNWQISFGNRNLKINASSIFLNRFHSQRHVTNSSIRVDMITWKT